MIDLTKPVQTRSGLPARVASTKLDGTFPVLAIVEMPDGIEVAHQYTAKGAFMSYPGESQLDLVNVPDEAEEFFNVYLDALTISGPKESVEEADEHAGPDRSFTLRVLREGGTITAAELANA